MIRMISFALFLSGLVLGLCVGGLWFAHDFAQRMSISKVLGPTKTPELSQQSIDIALQLYQIKLPRHARHPRYNPNLIDRGLSQRLATDDMITVEIGPSAFESWSLLGSTLAHEIEVHCHQNFFLINLLDQLGLRGTEHAERQAYLYEIYNSSRFGLTPKQSQEIRNTMDYYYAFDQKPSPRASTVLSAKFTNRIIDWLASPQ